MQDALRRARRSRGGRTCLPASLRCSRSLGFRVLQSVGHLLHLELVDARLHVFEFASAIGAEHRIGEQFFEAIFEQVIGAVALLGFDFVHHQVGKLFNVAVKMGKNKQARFSSVYKSRREVKARQQSDATLSRTP